MERAPCPKVSGVIPLCYISRKEMAFWSLAKRKRRFVSWRRVKCGELKIDSWDKLKGFLETSYAHFVSGNHILTLFKISFQQKYQQGGRVYVRSMSDVSIKYLQGLSKVFPGGRFSEIGLCNVLMRFVGLCNFFFIYFISLYKF